MKIGAHFHTAITDRVRNVLKIINGKFLRDHINDLVACRNICFVLVGDQLIDLTL